MLEHLDDDGLVVSQLLEEAVLPLGLRAAGVAEAARTGGQTDLGAHIQHPVAQAARGLCLVAGIGQLRQSEVSDGDEHVEAGDAVIAHAEQGVRHQGVEDVCGADPDQRLGGGEGEAVGEYRQPRQTAALSGVEQIPGPLDDGGQGALARRGVACARQQVGASGQAGEDLPHGEGAGAGGRQLDGQGDALEAVQEQLEIRLVDHLAGPGGQGAHPEEPGAGGVIQWLQTVDVLRAQVQGAA